MARKKTKKEEMKTQIDPTEDTMFGVLAKSEKKALQGIGPKTKQKQDLFEILGEKLVVMDNKGKEVGNPNAKNGEIEWNQIKDSKKQYSLDSPVEEWTAQKLFVYFGRLYYDKYGQYQSSVTVKGGAVIIKSLIAAFKSIPEAELMVNNSFIKTYLEWFAINELDSLVSKLGGFRAGMISDKRSMKKFLKEYTEPKQETNQSIIEEKIDFSSIEKIFNIDKIGFLTDYGVVVCMYWLTFRKKYSTEKSKKIINDILRDVIKDGQATLTSVSKTTVELSPYPLDYQIPELEEVLVSMKVRDKIQYANTAKSYV